MLRKPAQEIGDAPQMGPEQPREHSLYFQFTFNETKTKTARITRKRDPGPVSSSLKSPSVDASAAISIRHSLSTGNETAPAECKLSSTAVTFHFPRNFLLVSVLRIGLGVENYEPGGSVKPRKHRLACLSRFLQLLYAAALKSSL